MRVSALAKRWGIPSKNIVLVLNAIENRPHSASSRVDMSLPIKVRVIHERAIMIDLREI